MVFYGRSRRGGFTIVEISIVLAAIGLIIGGILIGKSLIRNAELQSVVSDVDRFRKASVLFRDKYKFLPGDMGNATEFWGAMSGCPETAASTVRGKATCDGTGDGFVGDPGTTPMTLNGTPQQVMESLRFWQHLANAGFVEGQYTGTTSSTALDVSDSGGLEPGLNIPKSRIPQSGFTLHYALTGGGNAYEGVYGHVINFGRTAGYMDAYRRGIHSVAHYEPAYLPAITSQEALFIDRQVDDGAPGTGNVRAFAPAGEWPDCASDGDAASAVYKTDEASYVGNSLGVITSVTCSLIFITGI